MKIGERSKTETASEYTLRVLKENIRTLELAPGSQISENELSAVLGVSRTPIREALNELGKAKLVEIYPQKKTTVSLIDADLVEEARFMRETMESAVVGLVCLRRTEEDLTRMEENIRFQNLYLKEGAKEKLIERDDAFHRSFFEITNNKEIYVMMQILQIHFDRVRTLSIDAVPDLKIVQDHEAILSEIRNRNVNGAKELLQKHLSRVHYDAASIKEKYPQYFCV